MLRILSIFIFSSILSIFAFLERSDAQECFIGEVRIFAGNFAPRNWALCDGQLLPINQNQALFSILGTTYGGDGRTNFGLPDLRGRVPTHAGNGPGLTPRTLGAKGGEEAQVLTVQEMPSHTHTLNARNQRGNTNIPSGNVLARKRNFYSTQPQNAILSNGAIGTTGGGQAHNNMPPFQALNYIICPQGIFPSRN
ncbi:tail fiber protein [Desulfobacterota bacterium AH_259_B03_O07]|nr:tail fiber protein [Desulfobacterota bacterium AH_259_B03_O07]